MRSVASDASSQMKASRSLAPISFWRYATSAKQGGRPNQNMRAIVTPPNAPGSLILIVSIGGSWTFPLNLFFPSRLIHSVAAAASSLRRLSSSRRRAASVR